MKLKSIMTILTTAFALSCMSAPVKDALGGKSAAFLGGDAGIIPVEYLESTGTQYLSLTHSLTSRSAVFFDIQSSMFTQAEAPSSQIIFFNTNPRKLSLRIWDAARQSQYGTISYYSCKGWTNGFSEYLPDRVVLGLESYVYNGKDRYYLVVDGNAYATSFYAENWTAPYDTLQILGSGFVCKLYGFQIFDDGVLTLDLAPVRVGDAGYMLDRISGELFGNKGTGDFVIGPDKQEEL